MLQIAKKMVSMCVGSIVLTVTGSEQMFVFIFIRLKIAFEGKLDLFKYIFVMQIFEFIKSLNLASN